MGAHEPAQLREHNPDGLQHWMRASLFPLHAAVLSRLVYRNRMPCLTYSACRWAKMGAHKPAQQHEHDPKDPQYRAGGSRK